MRDWQFDKLPSILYPYEKIGGNPIPSNKWVVTSYLWPYRTLLKNRTIFGKTFEMTGRPWYELLEHYVEKMRTPLSITYGEIATHNHFVLDRGGKVLELLRRKVKRK